MSYCKKFIAGLRQINFHGDSAQPLYQALLANANDFLDLQKNKIKERLQACNRLNFAEPIAQKQLQAYRSSLRMQIATIKTQKQQLERDMIATSGSPLDERFIADFADKFRSIQHLADTLSDAPPSIKALQTKLYVKILYHLSATEQEQQLSTLTSNNIADLLANAIEEYNLTKDTTIKHQCQRLVHMALFELIRRDCEKVSESPTPNYAQYSAFLQRLLEKITPVGASAILDNFSQFQDSKGRYVTQLLMDVETKLHISQRDWPSKQNIAIAQQCRALFHKLRFGQEDRREYMQKRMENMKRDLFWARTIRDEQLLTSNHDIDQEFRALAEHRFLVATAADDRQMATPRRGALASSYGKSYPKLPVLLRLEEALNLVKKTRNTKPPLFPECSPSDPLASADDVKRKRQIAIATKTIEEKLTEATKQATVRYNDGKIQVDLFFLNNKTKKISQKIFNTFLAHKGFLSEPSTIIIALQAESNFEDDLYCDTLDGESFDEIAAKIEALPIPALQKEAYRTELNNVRMNIQYSKISELKLGQNEELLLRKILELYIVKQKHPELFNDELLRNTFDLIQSGQYREALAPIELTKAVDQAFSIVTEMDANAEEDKRIADIIRKSKIMTQSVIEQQQKLKEFEAIIASSSDPTSYRIDKLTELFLLEYQTMADTLGIERNDDRLASDIRLMAEDFFRLLERTSNGDPAIDDAEQAAYFQAIQQIAEAIKPPHTFHDARFKLKHTQSGGDLVIVIHHKDGDKQTITLHLDAALPYSLIKPPNNDDCLFSYGGTRGIIAPFAGLEKAYGKKQRLFTHSRLVGVGQYGTVKEIESLLTGLNRVGKKGYVPPPSPAQTFQDSARQDPRTKGITARDDRLFQIENDILKALAKGEKFSSSSSQYWLELDRERHAGELFQSDSTPEQYQIIMERAQGDTYADRANRDLIHYQKGSIEYHDPTQREAAGLSPHASLKDLLSLSQAIVVEATRLEKSGFAHNDIKPENFLYKPRLDGSYAVRFIDWATGGFEQQYDGSAIGLQAIFKDIFGHTPSAMNDDDMIYSDKHGRFVKGTPPNITYGINPKLEILHGARNCTAPYISPVVALGKQRERHCTSKKDASFDTPLETNDARMDNWALCAMLFGICNRQAYFELVRGRTLTDYVIPGIIAADEGKPTGLKIINVAKYNEFFACRLEDQVTAAKIDYANPNAVMYIPSNQREGEPLHLYRRLLKLKAACEGTPIAQRIESILQEMHAISASGEAPCKTHIDEMLAEIQRCITDYEKLNDQKHHDKLQHATIARELIEKYETKHDITADRLLIEDDSRVKPLIALCLYPNAKHQDRAIVILDRLIDTTQLQDKFLGETAPCKFVFKDCIAADQTKILFHLLSKINGSHPDFIKLISEQGLLHHAFQKGATEVARVLIDTLHRAGASDDVIFDLMLKQYGPHDHQTHIKWSTNAFHIAIRDNHPDQLSLILNCLTADRKYDAAIKNALHLCAVSANPILFNQIRKKYDELHPSTPLTAKDILTILPPDNTSPYHLFLQDETASRQAIDWVGLKAENGFLARPFLLEAPPGTSSYPCLIAAKNGNDEGLTRLFDLAEASNMDARDWEQLLAQTDEDGKNILNHLLEQNKFVALTKLINLANKQLPERCRFVFIYLLNNIDPNNPLKNFLDSKIEPIQQFETLNLLLNTLCENMAVATVEQQQARSAVLLANKNWLIAQANNPDRHETLRSLLQQNTALSIPFKQIILKALVGSAESNSIAKQFYTKLFDEISPQISAEDEAIIKIQKPLLQKRVATQLGDIPTLMSTFAREIVSLKARHEAELQQQELQLTAAYQKEIQQLQMRLDTHSTKVKSPEAPKPVYADSSTSTEEEVINFDRLYALFSAKFAKTNSTGIKEIIRHMERLAPKTGDDDNKLEEIGKIMHQIASSRLNNPWSNLTIGMFKPGRSPEVKVLYSMMAKDDFSLDVKNPKNYLLTLISAIHNKTVPVSDSNSMGQSGTSA